MADIRALSCWDVLRETGAGEKTKGGKKKEGAQASQSYYLHLAVRNHAVMHYMCSLLCSVCKGSTNREERDEKCTFRSIRLPYTTVFLQTDGRVQAYFVCRWPSLTVLLLLPTAAKVRDLHLTFESIIHVFELISVKIVKKFDLV